MDSNSKLGPQIIPKDPHCQSANGKILADIISRHGLIVANGLEDKCLGTITRRRVTVDSVEESIIDHVLISEDLKENLEQIKIDEERNSVLTSIIRTKKGINKSMSDHNPIVSQFKIDWCRKLRNIKVEMFNLKNKEGQERFKELTSEKELLSGVFSDEENVDICTKKFLKVLDECIRKSFKKIRITDRPNKVIEELFKQRTSLRTKKDEKSKKDLEAIENKLAELLAKDNYEKIIDEVGKIDCQEGGINSSHLWKLKKKLSPKCRDPPTAMLDNEGNLITSELAIEALAVNTYKKKA